MKTAMKSIKIDHTILQDETDKLLTAIAAYRKVVLERASSISKNFEAQALGMDALAGNFVDSLQSMAGKTIIDILNMNNELMLTKQWEQGDFGNDPLDQPHERFICLTERNYVHAPAKGFMGDRDDKITAKNILHDYLDATVIYYGIIRKKQGVEVNPVMIEEFVRKGHEFISKDLGNIVTFEPQQRPR